ncbi:transposase, Ptta/En/Spm [Tanacetum coccineum]
MGQCSNAMEDDEVDAATHMELNNPTDYNLGSSSEEKKYIEEEIPTSSHQGLKTELSWKSDLNIPVEALNVIVRDIKSMLPKDNKQVENFYKVKKTSRYKSGGRKVPNLLLTYMPIADRLQMLYISEKTEKDMTWHADHKTADGSMSYVQLELLIPGRNSPVQNIDVFLRPLINELKDLYNVGVDTYDAYRRQNFRMKAILLWTVSDFPAYAMLSGWSTHGKLACPHCMGNIDSFQLKHGGKSCWFDCHRRFLPLDHAFRRDRKGFRAKNTVSSTPPPELNGFEIWQQISAYLTVYEGTPYNPKNTKIHGFGVTHNWVKRSIFWELPYWHLLLVRHNLDVMHIEKNVSRISSTLSWTLQKQKIISRQGWISRSMIPNAIWDAIIDLCTLFHVICSKELHIEDLETLKDSIVVVTLCKLEKVFPPDFFDLMEHLVINLILSGPDLRNKQLKDLAYGPINKVTSHKRYIVNGYKFHTLTHGGGRVTNNTGVCVKGSCYNEEESDYYEELEEVIEVDYHSMLGTCMVVLFKCRWFDPIQGNAKGVFQVAEGILGSEIFGDDNIDGEDFFQENDRLVCTIGTTEEIQPVTLVREEIEEVQTVLVTDDTNYDGEEEEFEDTNGDDDSSDDIDLDSSTPTRRGGSSIVGRGREIANEWSPRGRGNNSSSGNGRGIPDEYSPIGRGSNNHRNVRGIADDCSPRGRGSNKTSGNGKGRADDCSPRGRGSNKTSGNGKGRADDCSPRGRGSNNTSRNGRYITDNCSPRGRGNNSIGGRGNKSADKWCPSPDIFGDERLDVHEDNEEYMEHVVGSSQNQDGSNVTPSSSLPKLWLVSGVFYDPAISRYAVKQFKTMFKTFYQWEDAERNQIRDAWESHIKNRYSDIMRSVRKAAMKATRVNANVDIGRISSNLPNWIGANDWQPMVNVWDTDEWRLKSKTAKENRDKSKSGKHTAGSRSFLHTKIVMEKKKGRKVKLVELHTAVHTKKGTKPREPCQVGIRILLDPSTKNTDWSNEENTLIDENGSKSPHDDFEVWKGIGTNVSGINLRHTHDAHLIRCLDIHAY